MDLDTQCNHCPVFVATGDDCPIRRQLRRVDGAYATGSARWLSMRAELVSPGGLCRMRQAIALVPFVRGCGLGLHPCFDDTATEPPTPRATGRARTRILEAT